MSKDYWNGSYDTSKEGKQSLADDIMDAGLGKFATACGNGTLKETPNSINFYGPDSNSSDGHSHMGVNSKGEVYKK